MDAQQIQLSEEGQLSLPKDIMERLGLEGGEMLLLDVTEDGAILLRPTYPLEVYSDERVREFLEADEISEKEREALSKVFPSHARRGSP